MFKLVATVLTFTLVGPCIGLFVFLISLSTIFSIGALLASGAVAPVGFLALVLVTFHPLAWIQAYQLGWLPALITGVTVAAWDRSGARTLPRGLLAGFLGFGISLIRASFDMPATANPRPSPWEMDVSFAVAGFFAALLCARMTRRWS